MQHRFEDRVYLVTGATSGIGREVALKIKKEGGQLIATGRDEERLSSLREELCDKCLVLKSDAGDASEIKSLADQIKEKYNKIDGAFINAGFGKFSPTAEINESHIDDLFNVNVKGVALITAQLESLLKRPASIVITSSVAPYLGMPSGAIYAASKGAVSAMTRSFARDLAVKDIRVNSVCPGPIETRFFKRDDNDSSSSDSDKDMEEQIKNQVPLGRFGKSEEVAKLVTFLLSDDASYITGSEYMIDGGMTLR